MFIFLIAVARSLNIFSKEDRLLQLVIIIESACPSAQMVIVSLNALGFQLISSKIAYMYVFQYLACVVTITIVATCGLSFLYPASSR